MECLVLSCTEIALLSCTEIALHLKPVCTAQALQFWDLYRFFPRLLSHRPEPDAKIHYVLY